MAQYTYCANRKSLEANSHRQHAMALLGPNIGVKADTVIDDIEAIHQAFMVSIPAFDWSFETDILGRLRVTVHFKGAEVSIDAPN